MRQLGFALSLVFGAGSGWVARALSAVSESPPVDRGASTPPEAVERLPCPDTDLTDPQEAALAAGEREAEELERQIEHLVGSPRPFPEDIDRQWRPETASETVTEALKHSGFVLRDVRCETYPCLALLWLPEGASLDSPEPFEALGLAPDLPRHVMGGGETGTFWTVPLMTPPDPEDSRWIWQIYHRLDVVGEDTLLEEHP